MNSAPKVKWIKVGFYFGIGFCLAASLFYIIVSLVAGLIVPLLELALGVPTPDWFGWSLGIAVSILMGLWTRHRRSKASRISVACLIVAFGLASALYWRGVQHTSPDISLDQVDPVDSYSLELHRDFGHHDFDRCASVPLVGQHPSPVQSLADPNFVVRLVFGDLLAQTINKDSGRCRMEVVIHDGGTPLLVEDYFVVCGTEERLIIIPLEKIGEKIFTESFVGLMEDGGVRIPGMHELVLDKPWNDPIQFQLVKLKDS